MPSIADYFNQYPLFTAAVKFAVKDPLPRTEVQATLCDGDDDLALTSGASYEVTLMLDVGTTEPDFSRSTDVPPGGLLPPFEVIDFDVVGAPSVDDPEVQMEVPPAYKRSTAALAEVCVLRARRGLSIVSRLLNWHRLDPTHGRHVTAGAH